MRTRHLFALLTAAAALPAQVTFSHSDWPGVALQFDARLEPPGRAADYGMIGSVMTGRDRQHRLISDPGQKRYFGYDFRVEARSGAFQVRIEPLNLTPEELREVKVDPAWTKLSLPNYPVIPEAKAGDTIAIDVLVNPSTGHKIVDYISFLRRAPGEPAAPQDFSLADAALEVNAPKIRVNGRLVEATASFGSGVAGSNIWFYLPGHGRYVVSLLPHQQYGFGRPQKAGQVAGQSLTFSDSGVTYRLECNRRIAPGLGIYNIYVSHNAVWRPAEPDANEPFLLGSFD